MNDSGAYRIRLNGFWTATALPDGRTRCTRRFGRPRTLDDDESVWLTAATVPAPAVVAVNGHVLGATHKPRPFAFEIASPLEPRNAVTIDVRGPPEVVFHDVALEIRRLSFEPVRPSDYEFAHDLTRTNMSEFVARHWGDWDSDIFRKNFDGTENYLVYCCGSPVGFVRLMVAGDRLVLDDLQIVPGLQNQGLGTWALKQVEAIALSRGCIAVRLRSFHENPAYGLYRRVGFAIASAGEGADWLEKSVVAADSAELN